MCLVSQIIPGLWLVNTLAILASNWSVSHMGPRQWRENQYCPQLCYSQGGGHATDAMWPRLDTENKEKESINKHFYISLKIGLQFFVWMTHNPGAPWCMRSGADQCCWQGLGLGKAAAASRVHRAVCNWWRRVMWPEYWPGIGHRAILCPRDWLQCCHHELGLAVVRLQWPGYPVSSVHHPQPRHHWAQQVCGDKLPWWHSAQGLTI